MGAVEFHWVVGKTDVLIGILKVKGGGILGIVGKERRCRAMNKVETSVIGIAG